LGSLDVQGGVSKTGVLSSPSAQMQAQVSTLEEAYPEENEVIKIVQARIKGYEGDPCSSCGSFTLVRNGTCMKCDSCGSTTGCS
jgi:ribonucleoside-diphosphate reductase alpha chain